MNAAHNLIAAATFLTAFGLGYELGYGRGVRSAVNQAVRAIVRDHTERERGEINEIAARHRDQADPENPTP